MKEHQGDAGYEAPLVTSEVDVVLDRSAAAQRAIVRARREGYIDGLAKGGEYKSGREAGYKDGMREAKREVRDNHWAFGYVGGHHAALSEVEHAATMVAATTAIAFLHDYHWDEFRPAMKSGIMPSGWTVQGGLRVAEEVICVCKHLPQQHRVNGSCKSCACAEFRDPNDA